eukprot:1276180-Rhodomonas_salina.4
MTAAVAEKTRSVCHTASQGSNLYRHSPRSPHECSTEPPHAVATPSRQMMNLPLKCMARCEFGGTMDGA